MKENNMLSLYAIEKEYIKAQKQRENMINKFEDIVEDLEQYTDYEEALIIALDMINKK